jgi:hypothetical protein
MWIERINQLSDPFYKITPAIDKIFMTTSFFQSCVSLLESLDAVGTEPETAARVERFLIQPDVEQRVVACHRAGVDKQPAVASRLRVCRVRARANQNPNQGPRKRAGGEGWMRANQNPNQGRRKRGGGRGMDALPTGAHGQGRFIPNRCFYC